MQVWSRGLNEVDMLTPVFPLAFFAASFSGTAGPGWGEDLALFWQKSKVTFKYMKKNKVTGQCVSQHPGKLNQNNLPGRITLNVSQEMCFTSISVNWPFNHN